MSKQEKLILFYVGLFCIALAIISYVWQSDQYYSNAYTPVVEKARLERAIREDEQSSKQPAPAGFREKDIDKNRGNGFSTY